MLYTATVLGSAQIEALEVTLEQDVYHLRLSAYVDAPLGVTWATLTDYPRLHRLSEAVRTSEVLATQQAVNPWVYTQSHVCVWIFCRDFDHVQEMRSSVFGQLDGASIPELSDFAYGSTQWLLTAENGGTRFELNSQLKPGFWVPPLLGPMMLVRGLRDTALDALQGLEREARLRLP